MRRNFTVPYRPNRRQNTSLAGWVNWMQKWNRFISTSDRSDFYRTNVFILKHSHCSKQLTSLCLNSKSQICQNWKWIHFILHSIDSAREASENTFAVRQLEFSANITIVPSMNDDENALQSAFWPFFASSYSSHVLPCTVLRQDVNKCTLKMQFSSMSLVLHVAK